MAKLTPEIERLRRSFEEIVRQDDYHKVVFKWSKTKMVCDPFAVCTLLHPDTEGYAFGGVRSTPDRPLDVVHETTQWIETELPAVILPTRGDGCLYQMGWTLVVCTGAEQHVCAVEYWEGCHSEAFSFLAHHGIPSTRDFEGKSVDVSYNDASAMEVALQTAIERGAAMRLGEIDVAALGYLRAILASKTIRVQQLEDNRARFANNAVPDVVYKKVG